MRSFRPVQYHHSCCRTAFHPLYVPVPVGVDQFENTVKLKRGAAKLSFVVVGRLYSAHACKYV
jgi:hypothetical protein